MEISRIQILTVLFIVVIFILLFPIPMSRSREEFYEIMDTVSIPQQVVRNMEWQVTCKTLTPDHQWGAAVGNQTFPPTFSFNWFHGPVYSGYDDGIGFTAKASFYQDSDGLYQFTLGSDDGAQLYIDGTLYKPSRPYL